MAQKKKGGAVKVVVGGAVILALLGGLGLGLGGKLGFLSNATAPAMSQTEAQPAMQPEMTDMPVIIEVNGEENSRQIRVSESDIYFDGESVTAEVLRDKLLSAYDGSTPWELIDDHAIKADYDGVKALLSELNMSFVEKHG